MKKLHAIFGTVSVLSMALGAGAPAFAGEGGVAGAATFFLQRGEVVQSSVAGAIGKSNATATSVGGFGVTAATAFGSAGDLNTQLGVGIGEGGPGLSYNVQGKQDYNPEAKQAGTLGEVKLKPESGKVNY